MNRSSRGRAHLFQSYDVTLIRKPKPPRQRSAVSNGKRFLGRVDGRTDVGRGFADIIADLEAERGGTDALGVVERQAVRAFAMLSVRRELIEAEMAAGKAVIRLTNRIGITVTPASFKTVRGATLAAVVCDEIAFWHIGDAANPDKEILRCIPAAAKPHGRSRLWLQP
ncbi:hypothetical protein FPV16_18310 [Methylobacterium sp. W2]|uniref:hypothetical protein n=1 Tax=Methylobacterium sp. W2 TaxID=2598107 RepID=UPI001D0BFEC4|nr:hypothetical protein [Methylobacterium sp. W2]MCC0808139.1 hypothetical protein [Methylobacterium sp. W2]